MPSCKRTGLIDISPHSQPDTDRCDNLRESLRGATASAHDLLDGSMRAAAGWKARADYTRFLGLQYAARRPVEAWLSVNAPPALCPPAQCDLIAADLLELGEILPESGPAFALYADPASKTPTDCEVLGAAWVLAGSSLGNRAILKEVRRTAKQSGEEAWPDSFLGDDAMMDFWKTLRRRIERPADIDEVAGASQAAAAVFDHFIALAADAADASDSARDPPRGAITPA